MDCVGEHDVIICGGGLASMLLARQLRLYQPSRSVLILDKASEAATSTRFKLGESIPEGGSYHMRHSAALEDYLFTRHVPKFGFRFFFGGGNMPFAERLEYGGTQWPPFATFQLERPIVEDDLRALVEAQGAQILRGSLVTDIELSDGAAHRVRFERAGRPHVARGRWIIDATGRRRLLATKLGLRLATGHQVSASWFHVDGRVDISELVDARDHEWHGRTGPPRWYSTVHLAGHGYWVWVIPLISGATSIGVVTDERLHPVRERTDLPGNIDWCRRHEPGLARLLERLPMLDCGALKSFTHSTRQAFSPRRWACIGDAAVLADPLYALGQDLIGHGVDITCRLIELDFGAGLGAPLVSEYDRMFLEMFEIMLDQYRGMYPTFGSPFTYTQKLAWDSSMYFAVLQQTLMQNVYDDPAAPRMLRGVFARLAPLNRTMQRLFLDSYERDGRIDALEGMRTWAPRVTQFADSSLDKCLPQHLPEFFDERLRHLEGIGTSIFGEILRTSPSISSAHAQRVLRSAVGIEPRAASMDPERWTQDGLFDESRAPIDFEQPAQFDVQNRLKGEQRDFRSIPEQLRESAVRNAERVALVEAGTELRYSTLLDGVSRLAALAAALPGPRVGICVSGLARELQAMLGVLAAGKAFVSIDAAWDESQRATALERGRVHAIVTDTLVDDALSGSSHAEQHAPALVSASAADIRTHAAFFDIRFTAFGVRAVTVDHGALFRMCRWLPILMSKGLPESTDPRTLRYLWAGPASPECIVPMVMGCSLIVADDPTDGAALQQQLETHMIDIMIGRPSVWQALVDTGWPARGLRVVSVRDALPKALGLRLRARARRVCDFGYATFAH